MSAVTERWSIERYRAFLARRTTGRSAGTEEDLHRACFAWLVDNEHLHPRLRYLFHPANGGKRPKGEAGKLRAMGVRKGVLDFLLPCRSGLWTGLAIELKIHPNKPTVEQAEWLTMFEEEGWLARVCFSLDEFQYAVAEYAKGVEGDD
jgi:hypothetical protein